MPFYPYVPGEEDPFKCTSYCYIINNTIMPELGSGRFNNSVPFETSNFNSYVIMGDRLTNGDLLFNGCKNFNSVVHVSTRLVSAYKMFDGCSNFNFPVDIPQTLINGALMFNFCVNFNQSITIPPSLQNGYKMFDRAIWGELNVTLPNTLLNASYMFGTSNIYEFLYGSACVGNIYVDYSPMCNYSKMVCFYFNPNNESWYDRAPLNVYCKYVQPSWVQTYNDDKQIEYTELTGGNGWYNSLMNIYLYNNC